MPKNSVSPSPLVETQGAGTEKVGDTTNKPNHEDTVKAFAAVGDADVQESANTLDTIPTPEIPTRGESVNSNEIDDGDDRGPSDTKVEQTTATAIVEQPIESAEDLLKKVSLPPADNFDFTDTSGNTNKKVKMHPQATLDALRPVVTLKIRQTNRDKEDFANVPNHYEVVAEKGIIFSGQEETKAELRVRVSTSTNRSQPFTLFVHDVDTGDQLLTIQRNGYNDSPTQVFKQVTRFRQEEVGTIIPDVGWNIVRPGFTVVDDTGQLLFRILGPDASLRICHSTQNPKAIFEVVGDSGKDFVAKISKDGELYVDNDKEVLVVKDDVTIAIQFERRDLDLKKKTLIMAAGLMLDYTYYSTPSFLVKICNPIYGVCC